MTTLLPLIAALFTTPALAQDATVETRSVDVDVDLADQPRGFGIGVVLGEPTGLTMAYRPTAWNAVQGHVSWSLVTDRARANVDYLQTLALIRPSNARLEFPLYLGLGGTIGVGGPDGVPPWEEPTAWLGGRVPFGISMLPEQVPVEVFGEIAPVVYVLPETTPGMEGSLGVRAYF